MIYVIIFVLVFYLFIIYYWQYREDYIKEKALIKLQMKERANVKIENCIVGDSQVEIVYSVQGTRKTAVFALGKCNKYDTSCIDMLHFGRIIL